MKILYIFLILTISCFCLVGCKKENNTDHNIQVDRTDYLIDNVIDDTNNSIFTNLESESEIELSSFSTILKSKQPGRLNNIRITCSKINEYIVENEEEFSFCNIVGKATVEEGYQKASVIVNKKTIQALGGGNCQVSTTLYNAVLAVPELEVIERHPHGKKVNYVPEGQDAAVSYGSLDLKFKNKTGSKIKIYASSDDINVNIKIVEIQE